MSPRPAADPVVEQVPASAPARVRDWLRTARDGEVPVVHRGTQAVYVEISGRAVGVLARGAVAVPCGLRTALPDLTGLPLDRAHVAGGVLHVGGVALPVRRLVDAAVPRLAHVPVAGTLGAADVHRLLGDGDGLTPYGDDVLCGWLAVHRAAGVATPEVDARVHALRGRTTLLSATLLECASYGEVVPPFAAWLAAVGTPGEAAAETRLRAVGASSGAGLLEGARRALGPTAVAA